MYLFKTGLLPNYFRNMFTVASQLHSHYTRNCNLYYIPPCQTNIRNFSIRFQGPKFFNSLSLGQTDRQVVASGRKLNLRRDLRWVAKRLASFFARTRKSQKKTF